MHDLPLSSLNLRVVKDIILAMGEVINSKADDKDYVGSNFMRVRVTIDITKPLCKGRKIGLSNGEES